MNLKKYLKLQKISNNSFSKLLGISPVSLSRYISGERFPEKNILINIYNLTEGFVTPNDFCFENFKENNVIKNEKENLKIFTDLLNLDQENTLEKLLHLLNHH